MFIGWYLVWMCNKRRISMTSVLQLLQQKRLQQSASDHKSRQDGKDQPMHIIGHWPQKGEKEVSSNLQLAAIFPTAMPRGCNWHLVEKLMLIFHLNLSKVQRRVHGRSTHSEYYLRIIILTLLLS
eukprot:TRINITY_DN36048_c1_g1_i1.p1 TRINITY_DN36048_c1_g1~~TRINITY_DN36048_c1_g1_i1.p1  ORF type:complete len:125 (+),score=13.42 TRINITY_DN36048_c1_g1_i1:410-784(+)